MATEYRAERARKFDFNRNLIEHQDRDGVVYRSTYKSWNLPHEWIDHHGGRTVMEYLNADEKLSGWRTPEARSASTRTTRRSG